MTWSEFDKFSKCPACKRRARFRSECKFLKFDTRDTTPTLREGGFFQPFRIPEVELTIGRAKFFALLFHIFFASEINRFC